MNSSKRGGSFVFDIVKAIHEAIHTDSTWAFVLVISLGCAFIGGMVAYIVDRGYKNQIEDLQGRTELSVIVPSNKIARIASTGSRTITEVLLYETEYDFDSQAFTSGNLTIHSFSKPSGPIARFERLEPNKPELLDLKTIKFFTFAREIPKTPNSFAIVTKVYCLRFEFKSAGKAYVLYKTISSTVDMPSFFDDGAGVAGGMQLDYIYDIPEHVRRHQKRLFSDANLIDISPTRQQ